MTKGDLIHFLADVSGVGHQFFGDISLLKNCSYFDVDSTKDKGFGNKFKGIEIDDRHIRVNRDDEGGRNRKSGNRNKKYQSKSSKPKRKGDKGKRRAAGKDRAKPGRGNRRTGKRR